ncbi:hypothetical protein Agabi119p4_2238 [Agaricus bisporus var. burnettii]|uniref:Uncharacterized protein n=1 Tax=Agaricus bisporus var. burnettii TaxID=192524 RepID=A0A8H7F8W4_AGABI|nr:hypothetical protein Agabi119p4_2238 [Agaricus bisporus var. burnettii]
MRFVMHHIARIKDYFLINTTQNNQSTDIDSECVLVPEQETQMSNEAPSTSSSFYLISEGTVKNSSAMPSKTDSTPELEMASLSRQLHDLELDNFPRPRTRDPDNVRRKLEKELERLKIRETKMTRRINDSKQKLKSLEARDEEEKWEDDLYETRIKELKAANAIIETRSSVSEEDIINRVREINEQIIYISSVVVGFRSGRPHVPSFSDAITNALGQSFLSLLQTSGYHFGDKRTIQALLQIFLARSSAIVVRSWHPRKYLDCCFDQLYNRIAVDESQALAGKWRQMAFKHLPRGPDKDALQQCTINIVHIVSVIASGAGWGGSDASDIHILVRELLENAEIVRGYMKMGVISADIQVWIARHGDIYDPVTMESALNETGTGSRVLGSTGIGLRVRRSPRDDDETLETLLPSKVFCIRG